MGTGHGLGFGMGYLGWCIGQGGAGSAKTLLRWYCRPVHDEASQDKFLTVVRSSKSLLDQPKSALVVVLQMTSCLFQIQVDFN